MCTLRPNGHLLLLLCVSALVVLSAMLLSPGEVRGQNAPMFPSSETGMRNVAENTASGEDIGAAVVATDSDTGDVLTYSLEGTDAASFDIVSTSGQLQTKSALDFETKSSYSVTVKVSDDETTARTATQAVTITVTNVDEAGTVTTTGTLEGGEELTASVTDLDGTVTSLTWQWSRGETATGTFDDITGATSSTYRLVVDDVGEFVKASASYTDPEGSGKSAEAVTSGAIIASNAEPAFADDSATRTLPENSVAGGNVGGGTITATDGDNDTLTYSLTGTDAGSFEIDSNGQIKTKTGVPHNFDFEATKKSYSVTVQVADSKDAANDDDTVVDDTIAVTINLTDVNEAPTITTSDTTKSVPENTTTVLGFAASDVDNNGETDDSANTLTWSVESTADGGKFSINPSTGALTFSTAPDFETPTDVGDIAGNNTYVVTVIVTDNGIDGNRGSSNHLNDTHEITVTVTNVNEAPVITTADTTKSVAENSTAVLTFAASDVDASDTQTWSVETADDGGKFEINSSGVLSFKTAPNFEMPNQVGSTDNEYTVTAKVTDSGGLFDTHSLTITVTDVNETPVVGGDAGPSFAEIEYDVDGSTLTTTHLTVPGTYTFTDEDGDDVTWSLSGNDANHFEITKKADGSSFVVFKNPTPGTTDKPADFENPVDTGSDNTYVFVVEATDDNTTVAPHNQKGTFNVTVNVTNVDETPEITAGSNAPMFDEIEYDATSPALTVETYTARDEEGEIIEWSVDGTDMADFSINSSSGVLSFSSPPNFEIPSDREDATENYLADDNMYQIIVKATDGNTSVPNQTNVTDYPVTVTVTDVNEKPDIDEVTNDAFQYTEVDFYYTETPSDVHTFTATDYDDLGADPFTWSLSGDDMGDFSIGSMDGVLTFVQDSILNVGPLPSYEDPQDQGGDNTYEITVIATDDSSYAAEYAVTITIVDLEEAGAIAVVHTRMGQEIVDSDLTNLEVDDVLEFTLSDPDTIPAPLIDSAINWVIERRNPGDMNWVALTGQDVTSLTKEYTIDEDDTGKEIRATVTYTDRRGPNKTMESDDTGAAMDERDVAPPRFRSGNTQTIPEGVPGRNTLETIMATDKDGEVLIFGIQDGPNSNLFEILPSDSTEDRMIDNVLYTGYIAQLRAIEALDFETLSPDNTFELTLTLSDGMGLSNGRVVYDDEIDVTYDVTIEVTNVEEPGEITFSPEEVPEPGVQIMATLADPDGSISGEMWQWQRSEDPEAEQPVWEDISGETSGIYTPHATNDVIASGDNEGEGYYLRATVSYTDGEDSGKSAEAIAGQVGTANTRPQFPSSETGQRTVPENSRAGTNIGDPVAAEDPENNSLTYTLSELSEGLDDSEAFTIVSSTGQLRVKEPLDFENGQTQYIFNVDVHDRRDAAGRSSSYIDDTQLVIITLENVDEEGTVTLTTDTNRIQATVPVTAGLSDPDNPSGINWQWARSSNRSDWEDIATGATYTPSATDDGDSDEEDQGKYLRVTASYTDGEGSGKTAEIVTSRVASPPPTNAAPVFPDAEDGQRELQEDAGSGTLIGGLVQATDFNNDTLTYSLSGSDSSLFTIDASGQLRLQLEQDEALDYERKRTYRFTVQVSDGKNDDGVADDPDNQRIDDTISVTVSLIDVNEAPVIAGEAEREFRENGTSSVASYSARDPEGDSITWAVSGTDFVITDRGQLYFIEPPSFEDGETYRVTVTATDDGEPFPLSASLNITVTVTDVEERGEVILQPTKGWFADAVPDDPETPDTDETLPALQTRFTATLEDGDTPITNLSWQWARTASEDIAGATSSGYTTTADDVSKYLRVTATYRDNRSTDPMDPTDITERTVTGILRAAIRDTSPGVNTQPQFTVPTVEELPEAHFDTRTITSGAVSGRSIGSRVSAKDDDGDILTYMLGGRDADKFELDPANGQIRTRKALDYLEQDTYTLLVSVHDGFDATYKPSASIDDTISIIITVLPPPPPRRTVRRSTTVDDTPPNRPAEFSDGETTNRSVVQDVEAGTNVGRPVAASDPDGDTLTYALGGADAESFDIDAMTGQLQTKDALDAETKSSYSVTVSVTDNKNAGGGRLAEIDDTINVTITVTTMALSEIAAMYDADEDGLISRDEAIAAVNDFFSGDITRDQVLEIIALYFESPATITELLEYNGEENE